MSLSTVTGIFLIILPLARDGSKVLANFDPVAHVYDETRDQPTESEIRALLSELKDTGRVLDIPVGTGRLAKPLQNHGLNVTGIDISTNMLSRAKAKKIHELARGEVTHLPFQDRTFDAAITIHFLHLIQDWVSMFHEVTRVTRHKFVSIDSRNAKGTPGLRRLYLQNVKSLGFTPPTTVDGELKLAEKVKPYKMELIETSKETRSMEMLLEMFEKRWTAITWGVPEEVHSEAVAMLRETFSGKQADFYYETFLLVWKIEDLHQFFKEME